MLEITLDVPAVVDADILVLLMMILIIISKSSLSSPLLLSELLLSLLLMWVVVVSCCYSTDLRKTTAFTSFLQQLKQRGYRVHIEPPSPFMSPPVHAIKQHVMLAFDE